MPIRRMLLACAFAATCLLPRASFAAAPQVHVVVGSSAPQLERFAAEELAGQFKRLFAAGVDVSDKVPEAGPYLVLVGSPGTNPAVKRAIGDRWPKLTDQGLVIRSVPLAGRTALVVGGGSPVATLWAAYELGHRFGIRYLLSGDVYPAVVPKLKLDAFDIVMEPNLRTRTWRTVNDFAIGPEAWGLDEHRRVLRQLAKLKFNRILLSLYPWQPFVHYEFRGVKKRTAMLWYGYRYPIDADTAGRAAFRGAKEFYNPDLAGKKSYEEITQGGITLVRGIITAARELGMSTAITISPLEFPKEFASVLPDAKVLHSLESLVIGPGPKQPPGDPLLRELVQTQIRAYVKTYPQIDAMYFSLPEFPDWVEHHETAWKRIDAQTGVSKSVSLEQLTTSARNRKLIASGKRGVQALRGNITALDFFRSLLADRDLLRRPDGSAIEPHLVQIDPALFPVLDKIAPPNTGFLHFVDYTARRVAANRDLLAAVPTSAPAKSRHSLILTLADDNVGVLPQMTTSHLHALVGELRSRGWDGFSTRYWMIGDLDHAAHYLSRASFDSSATPEKVLSELVTPMCGDGVAERVAKGFAHIEQATSLIDEHDIGFTFPVPGVVMKHYTAAGPPPKWWKQVSDLYGEAMNEMYRSQDRSEQPGRPFLRYFAKRLEFATEYISSIQALRLAGLAKAKGDKAAQGEQLEKAVESMYNALSALGEVARDSGDRGVIAVLNEYGYRPLKKEFEAVTKE